jgi:hypothetical protein
MTKIKDYIIYHSINLILKYIYVYIIYNVVSIIFKKKKKFFFILFEQKLLDYY